MSKSSSAAGSFVLLYLHAPTVILGHLKFNASGCADVLQPQLFQRLVECELHVHYFALSRQNPHADSTRCHKTCENLRSTGGLRCMGTWAVPISMGVRRRESSASLQVNQTAAHLRRTRRSPGFAPVLREAGVGGAKLGLHAGSA